MIEIIDYAGNILKSEDNCPSCGYSKHQFELPCGRAYEDDICIVSQDWELPINGMIIVSPRRHICFLEEMTQEERVHIFEIVNKVISILKNNKIAEYFNVIFEEKENVHFHIWILPRDGWKELNIHPTKEIGKLQKYALSNLRTKENLDKILKTNQILNSALSNNK